jgi:hypothetical protein
LYTVAVDIGGTFTDVVVIDDKNGRAYTGNNVHLGPPVDDGAGVYLVGADYTSGPNAEVNCYC